MSGYDPIRIALEAPWEESWIEIEEPEMGFWFDYERRLRAVNPETGTVEDAQALLDLLASIIVGHNLTRRDGSPFEFAVGKVARSQLVAIVDAVKSIGDGTANPMPRATSPGRSSGSPTRHQRTSASGSSRRR